MQTQTLQVKQKSGSDVQVDVMIVCEGQNPKFKYNSPILGMPMHKWVEEAFGGYNVEFVDKYQDYLMLLKSHATTCDYTLIIGGNMPLLTPQDVSDLVAYCVIKQANLVKFTGGYVAKNNYIKSVETPYCDSVYALAFDNFYLVENKIQLRQATKILQDRIIANLENSGVDIRGKVVIEPKVEIEPNVTIFGGNTITGYSHICSGTILKDNNVIENSFVGEECCISGSVVTNSVVGDNCYISPFCNIVNAKIKDNQTIKSNTTIEG